MSLYNLLHGTNSVAPILLAMIDVDQPDGKWPSGRFRDIWVDGDLKTIVLHTRNGGGNRECWDHSWGESTSPLGAECRCPGCIIENVLPTHPLYLKDQDDDFDRTYANIYFRCPEKYLEFLPMLYNGEVAKPLQEKFEQVISNMQGMSRDELISDPRFGPFMDLIAKVNESAKRSHD